MSSTLPLVLLVDDDVDFLDTVALVLEAKSYRVATTTSGRKALELLNGGLRPALILLDLMMPDINGWAFREQQMASPELAAIPTVILSGDHSALRATAPTASERRLQKPVDLETLLRVVRESCRA